MTGSYATRVIGALSIVLASVPSAGYGADSTSDLNRAIAYWARQRTMTQTVRYEITSEVIIPAGRFNEDVERTSTANQNVPARDYHYPKKVVLTLDFAKSRYRSEVQDEVFNGSEGLFHPNFLTKSFDGTIPKALAPRDKNSGNGHIPPETGPELYIGSRDLSTYSGPFFDADLLPVFLSHGFISTAPDPRNLSRTIECARLSAHGYALQGGEKRLVLRTSATRSGQVDEFWVDPAREGVITRWLRVRPGYLVSQADIHYQSLEAAWVPRGWEMTSYYDKDLMDMSCAARVTAFSRNLVVGPETFQLDRETRPGMVVKDNSAGGQLFRVAGDGSLRPLLVDRGRRSSGWMQALIWGTLGLVIVAVAVCLVRRYGKRRS